MSKPGKILFQITTGDEIAHLQVLGGIKPSDYSDRPVVKKMVFDPQNNIDAFELARCMALIVNSLVQNQLPSEADIEALGEAKRHFKDA